MGLGKTFQTIGLLKNSPMKTLILCPPALLHGWKDELTACGFRVRMRIKRIPRFSGYGKNPNDVWLMTYPQSIQFPYLTRRMAFQRVVLDEGHVIRNRNKLWTACCVLAELSKTRWILSATPIQNGIKDWRNICHFIGGSSPTIMLRRTMDDIRAQNSSMPSLPVFHTHTLTITDESEGRLFKSLYDSTERSEKNMLVILERFLRLQQFIVHPQIYIEAMQRKYKGAFAQRDWDGHATKWEEFCSVLHDSPEPTIVFCQFRREIEMVAQEAMRCDYDIEMNIQPAVFRICGGEDIAENIRLAKIAVLQGKKVCIIVQIVSGGCGLNLQFCSRILFLSRHWNPAVVHQAVGRAVRIGQMNTVQIHIFKIHSDDQTEDSIDQRISAKHVNKINDARIICTSLFQGFAV